MLAKRYVYLCDVIICQLHPQLISFKDYIITGYSPTPQPRGALYVYNLARDLYYTINYYKYL
jgi:hypothetical protein